MRLLFALSLGFTILLSCVDPTGASPSTPAPCCQADAASRYATLAQSMPVSWATSICSSSFALSMKKIADMANSFDRICLQNSLRADELPVYFVGDDDTRQAVPRADGEGQDGWWLDTSSGCVIFGGEWVPQAGQEILLTQAS